MREIFLNKTNLAGLIKNWGPYRSFRWRWFPFRCDLVLGGRQESRRLQRQQAMEIFNVWPVGKWTYTEVAQARGEKTETDERRNQTAQKSNSPLKALKRTQRSNTWNWTELNLALGQHVQEVAGQKQQRQRRRRRLRPICWERDDNAGRADLYCVFFFWGVFDFFSAIIRFVCCGRSRSGKW